jgi:predicted RNA-binding protein
MCKFKVMLEGKIVYENVIYAKAEGNNVTVKDALGISKIFKSCKIEEIDVNTERLVLSQVEAS